MLGLLLDSDASTNTFDFSGFSSIAGHALVSYLYSGNYKALKWTGPLSPIIDPELVRLKAEFEIYVLARTVELRDLETQARNKIEGIADRLDVLAVVEAVRETYPTTIGNDTWFPRWIKSLIRNALRDSSKLPKTCSSQTPDFGDNFSVVKLFLGCMLETHAEMLSSPGDQDNSANEFDEPDTPVTTRSFEQVGQHEDFGHPLEPLVSLECRPAVSRPQTSGEKRELLRAALTARKRPVWSLVLREQLEGVNIGKSALAKKKKKKVALSLGWSD